MNDEKYAMRRFNLILTGIWIICAAIVGVTIMALIEMGKL